VSTSEDVVRAYFDALNERDYEKAAASFSEDCEFVSVASGVRFQGTDSMLHGLREFAEAFPDWSVEVANIVASGPYVATEWRTTGTHEGTFRGESPTGIRFRRDGCSVAEVEGERIVRYRDYYDRTTLLEQLGLPSVL
jgi:steroid delta-isomerase-like uncharacterized protein